MSATENSMDGCLFYVSSPRELKEELVDPAKPEVATLTRQMLRGNEDAWVQFHNEYSPRLFRYLLVLLRGDEGTANELLQITFTRIARHIRAFDSESILWHWAARIARTVVIDETRKRGRFSNFLAEMEEAAQIASSDQRWLEIMEEALRKMELEERELLSRKYIEGWSIREISTESALSEKAIDSKLVRARQKLRVLMLTMLNANE